MNRITSYMWFPDTNNGYITVSLSRVVYTYLIDERHWYDKIIEMSKYSDKWIPIIKQYPIIAPVYRDS